MPKTVNDATMARPDTDTAPGDVTTPQAPTAAALDGPPTGPAEAAGHLATDATAPDPAPAGTGPDPIADGRDGPGTAAPADPPTTSAGAPPTVTRTATRRRSTKPKVSDATTNATTSTRKTRTNTATTSAPALDADPGGATSRTTADSDPQAAPVDVETAPTASPEAPMSGAAAEGSIATQRPLRANPARNVRLKSGALQGLVEDFLTEQPGEHSPTAVGKAIARSSGAVANALERMVVSGWAIRTCDKPKRYRIAEGSDSFPSSVPSDDAGIDGTASDGSAVDAAPIINPDGANPHAPTASTPPADADNAPTAGRPTRRRTKTT